MRPHGIALKHHADIPLFRRHKGFPAGNQLIINVDLARGRLLKPGNHAEHGGLAAAGGPEKGNEFTVLKGFVEIPEHHILTKGLGDMPD